MCCNWPNYNAELESHSSETTGLCSGWDFLHNPPRKAPAWLLAVIHSLISLKSPCSLSSFQIVLTQFQFSSLVVYFFLSHSFTVRAAWQEGEQIFVLQNARDRKLQPLLYLLDHINSWSISMASWKRWIYIKCVMISLLFGSVNDTGIVRILSEWVLEFFLSCTIGRRSAEYASRISVL